MKQIFFAFLCLLAAYCSHSQSYVDSGIRHYNQKEYEEALIDFNEAEKVLSLFTAKAIAKLYYYKALTVLDQSQQTEVAAENVATVNAYFAKSLALDSARLPEIAEEKRGLFTTLTAQAEVAYKKASREKEQADHIASLGDYMNLLKLAETLMLTPEVELKLAEGYHELGDLFFRDGSNVASLRQAGTYYSDAIRYYEIARYNDPFSKSIIETLLTLSKRMDDPERVKEYSDLMTLAGG